jgi:hypothetical protein
MVILERYPFEWAQDREPRVGAAQKLAAALGTAASWKVAHTDLGKRIAGTLPKPARFAKGDFDAFVKKVVLQRFNANKPGPSLLIRTGGELDVQYAWSYRLHDNWLELFAHDTPANRARMESFFDQVRRAHEAAPWATLGHGYAGAMSWTTAGLGWANFQKHELAQLAAPWRLHIGRLWTDVPEAGEKADALAKKSPDLVRVDEHGVEISAQAPTAATDRAPTHAAGKTFLTLKNALGKIVNTVLHDKKRRKEILGR